MFVCLLTFGEWESGTEQKGASDGARKHNHETQTEADVRSGWQIEGEMFRFPGWNGVQEVAGDGLLAQMPFEIDHGRWHTVG